MNMVVTGATSFIGAPMVRKLLHMGHEVYAVVRPESKNIEKLGYGGRGLHIIERDLEEAHSLDEVIKVPCEAFFHFGWDGAGSENRRNHFVQRKNVTASLKALEGAKRLRCRTFLFSGSQAEYGLCKETMEEGAPLNPVSEYGRAKADFCRQAMKAADGWRQEGIRLNYVHARIFSIYGSGDHPWSLVESCLKAFQAGEYISLGECAQMWNFLYLDDMLEALVALWESGAQGVFNIAGESGETRPLKEYVRRMYEICGCRGSFSFGRRPQNAEGSANLIPSVKKLISATGWRQKTSFEEGMRSRIGRDKNMDRQEFSWYER